MRSALTLLLLILVDVWWISCRAYPQDGQQPPPDEDQGVGQQEQPTDAADQPPTVEPIPCNAVGLIKCFTEVLDEWILHLWNFREKIITISNDVCSHHRLMHFCANFPGCSRAEILNYSQIITDAILHRQNAGSFLKSYFFTEFSCSSEGRAIVSMHEECLSKYQLNDKALYLSHYIEHNFIKHLQNIHKSQPASESESTTTLSPNHENEWFCRNLTDNAQQMFDVATTECTILPGYLMCRSIVDAFLNLYPVQLAGCQVPCAKKPETANLNGLATTTMPAGSSRNRWKLYTVNLIISLVAFNVLT